MLVDRPFRNEVVFSHAYDRYKVVAIVSLESRFSFSGRIDLFLRDSANAGNADHSHQFAHGRYVNGTGLRRLDSAGHAGTRINQLSSSSLPEARPFALSSDL